MTKPGAMLLVACFMAASVPAFAQNSGGYQGGAPVWPQQAPQGYEVPQYDAYRAQAEQNAANSNAAQQGYQQPIQPESTSATRASASLMEQQQLSDQPIKPEKSAKAKKIKGAVGGIGRTLSHLALPVAGLGAIYMVTRAAAKSGYMAGQNSMGMGGMGMGGMGMGGFGGGMPMRMPGSYGW